MKIEGDVEELALILVTIVIIFAVTALNYSRDQDRKYEINLRQITNQIKYERP